MGDSKQVSQDLVSPRETCSSNCEVVVQILSFGGMKAGNTGGTKECVQRQMFNNCFFKNENTLISSG